MNLEALHAYLRGVQAAKRVVPDAPAARGALAVDLDRALRFRARSTHLDRQLDAACCAEAARAGLQDSAPRAALAALHARLDGCLPDTWEHPTLVQIWFRWADYVVPREDFATFTLGALPREPEAAAALDEAGRAIAAALDGRALNRRIVEAALRDPFRWQLRVAQVSGRYRIRWDARTVTAIPEDLPDVDPEAARLALARRFLATHGPATAAQFARWAGVTRPDADATWAGLKPELVPVAVDGGARDLLARDEQALTAAEPVHGVRLLPPGDPYLVLDGRRFQQHAPGPPDRDEGGVTLTTRLVNSLAGRILVDGRIAGAWGRERHHLAIHLWSGGADRDRVAEEAERFACPIGRTMRLRWLIRNS